MRDSIPYFLIVGIALFMFHGIFAPGFMSGYDNSLHYYESYYLTQVLIPQYHWISGWGMQYLAGCPMLLDYPQMGFLLIAFLNKALFLPLNLSYKLIVLFSYIFLGVGFYKITSHRFGKIAALLITTCLMLQKDVYYDRILFGVWNNYLAIGLFFIFFHFLDKNISKMTIRKALTLGLLLGLLIPTHLYVAMFGFILLFIYGVPYISEAFRNRIFFKQSLIYACIPLSALMISSYYLYGFIVPRNYFEKLGAEPLTEGIIWGLKSFFSPLESVNSVSTFMINIPIIARIIFSFFGIYIFFKKIKELNSNTKRILWSTFWFVIISLLLFSDILARIGWWQKIPFVTTLQIGRLLIYIQIGLYIFAAYGLGRFFEILRRRKVVMAACGIPILLSIFFHYFCLTSDASRTLDQSPQMSNVYKVWDWVNKNIPAEEGRIVYQNTVGNINDPILRRSDVFALSGVFTDIPQIGVSRPASPFPQEKYMRNDQGNLFGIPVNKIENDEIKERLDYFNAGHIVSVEPDLVRKLDKSGLFQKVKTFGDFNILRFKYFTGEWIKFRKDAGYKTVISEDQRMKFNIWNRSINNEALIKVAYHPFWQAWLNERPVKIRQDKYSLMSILLPEKGKYELIMQFNSFNPYLVAISLLSIVASIVVIVWKK